MASNMSNEYKNVEEIISAKNISPTIVNDASKFVVVTYWWGRNKLNLNTMRPCTAFYEIFVLQLENFLQKMLKTSMPYIKAQGDPKKMMKAASRLDEIAAADPQFIKAVKHKAKSYQDMMFEDLGINLKLSLEEKEAEAKRKINQLKEGRGPGWKGTKAGTVPPLNYEVKTTAEIEKIFEIMMKEVMHLIKYKVNQIYILKEQAKTLKNRYFNATGEKKLDPKDKKLIDKIEKDIKAAKNDIRKIVKNKELTFEDDAKTKDGVYFKNEFFRKYVGKKMNIYDILSGQLQYLGAVQFQEMIEKWETACRDNNCNFLSVEYPEFADRSDGYQLAINAKPLFIKKALESCGGRAVLYIDGDMFVRKYPQIFDMRDEIDFMARSWYIDPRSGYKMMESITYDPYTFETSGGIMWFSTSDESKLLLDKWIETAGSKSQSGRADDRVLSLVFNSYKMLCQMKVMPLPIEYLWLTLDYDERMLEYIYEWDYEGMQKTIYVEHSECLTTEESAGAAGAASDRSAKYSGFLEEDFLDPVSEKYHEYLNFPNKEMMTGMKEYLEYMKETKYLNDGNDKLIDKGFIDMDEDEEGNEQPLYITNFDDKWGNDAYFNDDSMTYNEIAKMHENSIRNLNINQFNLEMRSDGIVIINNFENFLKDEFKKTPVIEELRTTNKQEFKPSKSSRSKKKSNSKRGSKTKKSKESMKGGNPDSIPIESKLQNRLILSVIIKLLTQGKKVVFEPTYYGDDYNSIYFGKLIAFMNGKSKNCEFVYTPIFNNPSYKYSSSGFFKTEINLTCPMMFAPSEFLINFLKMFLSLEDLSIYIGNGSYEFMSRVRVGYNIDKGIPPPLKVPYPSRETTPENISKPSQKSRTKSSSKSGQKPKSKIGGTKRTPTVRLNSNMIEMDIKNYYKGLEAVNLSVSKTSRTRKKTVRRSSKRKTRRTTS